MQMLKASALIKNPNILRKLLASKYFFSSEDYMSNIADIFLLRKRSKINAVYNEVILFSDSSDYLKRIYSRQEITERIPKLAEYYLTYQMFFCRPTLNNWLNCHLLKKHFDKRAEVFYMNNYYSKNDGIVSFERNAYLDEESSQTNNPTNTRTIFDTKIKELINNVKDVDANDKGQANGNNIVLISTISFENNNLNTLNSSYDLYSKKSPMESLGNIVKAFKKGPPLIKRKIIQFNKKIIRPLSCSKEKEKDNEHDKSSTQPYKPYLHNYRSNLIEFTQNKPPLFISAKAQSKKNLLVKNSRNNQNVSSFLNKPNDNKTYDSKYAQLAKLSKPLIRQSHNPLSKDKKQTTRNGNVSLSSMTNIFNISQKSLNSHYVNSKASHSKQSFSTCTSMVNIRKKKEIIVKKPTLLIQASNTIKEVQQFSRNKKKEQYAQSIIMRNMTTLLSKENKNAHKLFTPTMNGHLAKNTPTFKLTKSVDDRDSHCKPSFGLAGNYKYSIRETSKNRRKCPMTLKISKQLTDLLRYSKAGRPSLSKYNRK